MQKKQAISLLKLQLYGIHLAIFFASRLSFSAFTPSLCSFLLTIIIITSFCHKNDRPQQRKTERGTFDGLNGLREEIQATVSVGLIGVPLAGWPYFLILSAAKVTNFSFWQAATIPPTQIKTHTHTHTHKKHSFPLLCLGSAPCRSMDGGHVSAQKHWNGSVCHLGFFSGGGADEGTFLKKEGLINQEKWMYLYFKPWLC